MRVLLLIVGVCGLTRSGWCNLTNEVVLENRFCRYVISSQGQNLSFVDRSGGTDYLLKRLPSAFAMVRVGGTQHLSAAVIASPGNHTLEVGFTGTPARVRLEVETTPCCLLFTVKSNANDIDALTFLNIPLTLKGTPTEPFAACALALNLSTRVDALPALQNELRAGCEKKFGITGAKAALVCCPMNQILPNLQQTILNNSQLPVCKVAGPWADKVPFNHGSYLFNFGTLTETNLSDWVEMTRSLGFNQIDNHGGGAFFRFGDMELNRQKWPDGWESFRRIVKRLHAEGIGSIFHSYAFFIDKRSRYVTPIPDPRLDAFREFTLAQSLSPEATEISVDESTAEISTVTGFFVHNSVVLQLGDELLTFGGATRQAPWRFTGIKRGEFGTKPAAHAAGSKARHLKECFGLFVPNPESSLFEEIAANHAEVVNRCEFDGIYLDAIDGSSILRPGEEWYWASKFVVEIQKRLVRPAGMEMSSMWHQFWQYRTRWQAWDYPQRGHNRFVDQHARELNGGLLLPLHLGWWSFQSFHPPQIEPTYPDVMENLGAKLIGWDAGISLTAGINRETLQRTPLFRNAVDILRTCEDMRHTRKFDDRARERLRENGAEFLLWTNAAGETRFRRVDPQRHKVALGEPASLEWQFTNQFAAQPAMFRIEALMSAVKADSTNAVALADFTRDSSSWKRSSAEGVEFELSPGSGGAGLCTMTATNRGRVPRQGAWARLEKKFDPALDLNGQQGLGMTVEGDGSGALLAVRLESPPNIGLGAIADRYVDINFTGRRYVTLIETESSRWSDYSWNDGKGLYNAYRETINFKSVESVSIWFQNLPSGQRTSCGLGPVFAVPMGPCTIKNPKLVISGTVLEFPVELTSGSWIEGKNAEDCRVYDSKGALVQRVKPIGSWPVLGSGTTQCGFRCGNSDEKWQPRAQVTFFILGEQL